MAIFSNLGLGVHFLCSTSLCWLFLVVPTTIFQGDGLVRDNLPGCLMAHVAHHRKWNSAAVGPTCSMEARFDLGWFV